MSGHKHHLEPSHNDSAPLSAFSDEWLMDTKLCTRAVHQCQDLFCSREHQPWTNTHSSSSQWKPHATQDPLPVQRAPLAPQGRPQAAQTPGTSIPTSRVPPINLPHPSSFQRELLPEFDLEEPVEDTQVKDTSMADDDTVTSLPFQLDTRHEPPPLPDNAVQTRSGRVSKPPPMLIRGQAVEAYHARTATDRKSVV